MAATAAGSHQKKGLWGRLKDVRLDPLESIGLPSKGDNRHGNPNVLLKELLDFATQETYFKEIEKRYERLSRAKGDGLELGESFANLSLDRAGESMSQPSRAPQGSGADKAILQTERELSLILQAMRKIREALVASARLDTFARDVYVYIIRATILTKHMESYHPALLHLLGRVHPTIPLSASDLHEILGYYILDLACRQADLGMAFAVRFRYGCSNVRIEAVLKALVHGNWWSFWKIKDEVDVYQRHLIEWADDRMRTCALECLGRSYLKAEKAHVEKSSYRAWEDLKQMNNVRWNLVSGTVMIRRIQGR